MEQKLIFDIDHLDEEYKNIAYVFIPNNIQENDIENYTNNIIAPYNDNYVGLPTIVAKVDDILKEFEEDKYLYDDINEFCLKMYGGYVNGENVVTVINYNSFWCMYKFLGHMTSSTIEMLINSNALNIPNIVIDVESTFYEKTKVYTEDSWKKKVLEIIETNKKYNIVQLEYI